MLYQKTDNGFSALRRDNPEVFRQGMTVYDPSSDPILPQYLITVENEGRLYVTRKVGEQHILMQDNYRQYDETSQSRNIISAESRLTSAPQSLIALSAEDQSTLRKIHGVVGCIIETLQTIESATFHADSNAPQSMHDQIAKKYEHYVEQQLQELFDDDLTLEKFELFFKNHWDEIKGTALSYTALPDHPMHLLLIKMAEQLAPTEKNKKAITILMPDIATASQFPDNFPDLDKINIREILKTHILSDDHRYLLPVRLFADRPPISEPSNQYPPIPIDADFTKITNPYCDHYSSLTESELQRFALHNAYAAALFDFKKQHDEMAHDKSTLLGQLNRLIYELRGASASSHGGRGRHAVAASGAFPAITAFHAYYSKLTDEQKNQIPEAVKTCIDTLIRLSSVQQIDYDVQENTQTDPPLAGVIVLTKKADGFYYSLRTHKDEIIQDAKLPDTMTDITRDKDAILDYLVQQNYIPASKQFFVAQAHLVETCVGTQSEQLTAAVSAHQAELIAITLSAESKTIEFDRIRAQYDANQVQLAREGEFCYGREHIGINKRIVDLLAVPPAALIHNDASLKEFMLLTPEEISELCQMPDVQKQILRVIDSFENWVIFFTDNSAEKIQIVLRALASDFCDPKKGVVKTATDLSNMLTPLTNEKCRAVCEAIKDQLPQIIHRVFYKIRYRNVKEREKILRDTLELLPPEQYTIVFARLFQCYLDPLKQHHRHSIAIALKMLSPKHRTIVFTSCRDQLLGWIKSRPQYIGVMLKMLDLEEDRTLVFENCKDHVLKEVLSEVDNGFKIHDVALPSVAESETESDSESDYHAWVDSRRLSVMNYLSLDQQIVILRELLLHHSEIIRRIISNWPRIKMIWDPILTNSQREPGRIIELLHTHLYSLVTTTEVSLNTNFNRSDTLKFIKQGILFVLQHTRPQDMNEAAFKQAEQFLSLHRNFPNFQFFGHRSVPDSLKDAAYLKHKNYFDSLRVQPPSAGRQ